MVERKGCPSISGWEKTVYLSVDARSASEQRPSVAKEKRAEKKTYTERRLSFFWPGHIVSSLLPRGG